MRYAITLITVCLLGLCLSRGTLAKSTSSESKKCLFVASYHQGYEWQDGIERGLRAVLADYCEIKQFDMDTKRNPSPEFGQRKALEAKALIESWKPDVVIASDDNASKYLVAPYFKNASLPIVFCGINWTVKEYGYPYDNATGMIEIQPIRQTASYVAQVLPEAKTGVCLRPDRLSSKKSCSRNIETFAANGIELMTRIADNMDEFEAQYKASQEFDFIVIQNPSTMTDWDSKRAKEIVARHSSKLSLTMNRWDLPYTMLGFTIVPEEQGEYAGKVALRMLEGVKPAEIPVVPNRKWNTYVNKPLLKQAGIVLPAGILQQAEHVE